MIDDLICVWLDKSIPILERLEMLRWHGEKDISVPEAMRSHLFYAIKEFVQRNDTNRKPQRKAFKFPSSVISRVHNAISHLNTRRNAEVERQRNTVFLPTTLAQFVQQIPVARALEESEKSYCFVFPTPKWSDEMDLAGLDIAPHTRTLQSDILSSRLRARVQWLRLGREQALPLPQFVLDGKSYDLGRVVLDTIAISMTAIFEAHTLAKHIIHSIRPKLIVLGNDLSPTGRVLTACAKNHGIRSVSMLSQVQEGPIESYRSSDRFVVFGNYSKRILLLSGIDIKNIKACGTPYLDALATQNALSFLTPKSDENHRKSRFILLDLDGAWASRIQKIARALPSNFFLYLAEAKDNEHLSQMQMSATRNFKVCMKSELSNGKLAMCLKSADLIVASTFKTAIEAIGLGKSVVAMDDEGRFDNRDFLKSGVSLVATNEGELLEILADDANQVDSSLENSRRNFLEDYFYRRDGNAPQRIARVLIEECQK